MWLLNDYTAKMLVEQREAELLRQAQIRRFLAEARAEKPGIFKRLLATSGRVLVRLGQRLERVPDRKLAAPLASGQPCSEGTNPC